MPNDAALQAGSDVAELWRRLGRAAGLLYAWLTGEVQTPAELVRLSGKAQSTAYAALAVLAECGLAEKVGTGWRRSLRSPAGVASDMLLPARVAERRQWLKDERENYQTAYGLRIAKHKARVAAVRADNGSSSPAVSVEVVVSEIDVAMAKIKRTVAKQKRARYKKTRAVLTADKRRADEAQ